MQYYYSQRQEALSFPTYRKPGTPQSYNNLLQIQEQALHPLLFLKMHHKTLLPRISAGTVTAQVLNIPTRVGDIISLPQASVLSGVNNMGNKEYDRGQPCTNDADNCSNAAVFVLEDGATLSDVIIGKNALEGVHCLGTCTLRRVWFRDVCEGKPLFKLFSVVFPPKCFKTLMSFPQPDAVSVLGNGNALIEGGGAQEAVDKVIQHNGRGTVTNKDFAVVNAGKLYRGCGDCSNNGGPRNVIVQNVKANNVADLVGINSNFGDTSSVAGTCRSRVGKVCQEFQGVQKAVDLQARSFPLPPAVRARRLCLHAENRDLVSSTSLLHHA